MTELRECSVCWYVYDPALGDGPTAPGTAFEELPEDFRCPRCDAPRERFVRAVAEEPPRVRELVRAYRDVVPRMLDLPVYNSALSVEAVGFASFESGLLGILITPWFMNLVYLPDPGVACLGVGQTRRCRLPVGEVELLGAGVAGQGGFEICPLFSPMQDFPDQATARATAEKTLELLFTKAEPEIEEPRAEVSRRELFSRFGAR